MDSINLDIELHGFSGKDYPNIVVELNENKIFSNKVKNVVNIQKNITVTENNSLKIIHHDKNNDTIVDSKGSIIRDRYCLIKKISINNIIFDENFFSHNKYYYLTNDGEEILTNYLGIEGIFKFTFPYPLYKFWYSLNQYKK